MCRVGANIGVQPKVTAADPKKALLCLLSEMKKKSDEVWVTTKKAVLLTWNFGNVFRRLLGSAFSPPFRPWKRTFIYMTTTRITTQLYPPPPQPLRILPIFPPSSPYILSAISLGVSIFQARPLPCFTLPPTLHVSPFSLEHLDAFVHSLRTSEQPSYPIYPSRQFPPLPLPSIS